MNTPEEQEIFQALQQGVTQGLNRIEKQTTRKTTIDSIMNFVPSSTLNSAAVNQIESNHLEQHRISVRNPRTD